MFLRLSRTHSTDFGLIWDNYIFILFYIVFSSPIKPTFFALHRKHLNIFYHYHPFHQKNISIIVYFDCIDTPAIMI